MQVDVGSSSDLMVQDARFSARALLMDLFSSFLLSELAACCDGDKAELRVSHPGRPSVCRSRGAVLGLSLHVPREAAHLVRFLLLCPAPSELSRPASDQSYP